MVFAEAVKVKTAEERAGLIKAEVYDEFWNDWLDAHLRHGGWPGDMHVDGVETTESADSIDLDRSTGEHEEKGSDVTAKDYDERDDDDDYDVPNADDGENELDPDDPADRPFWPNRRAADRGQMFRSRAARMHGPASKFRVRTSAGS